METLVDDVPTAARRRRSHTWLFGLGLVLAVLGIAAVFATFTATLATIVLFGALILAAGVAQLLHAFAVRSLDFGWEVLSGLVYAAVGVLLVADPAAGAIGFTLLLALFFLAAGGLRFWLAARARRRGARAGAYTFVGVLDLLLGVLILAGWPGTAAWVIGLFVGLELVFAGTALMMVAAEVRRVAA